MTSVLLTRETLLKTRMQEQFVRKPLQVRKDVKKHRKEMLILFLAAFIYSIVYGIFEYTVMYTNPGYVRNGIISPYVNWTIMYVSLVILMTIVTRGKIELIILGVFFFLVFEDLVYHICYGIDIQAYPFPVYDWWDEYLASFRVLGRLGQAVPFWPYAPLYYLPGFLILLLQFSIGIINVKGFRIVNWIIEPFIVAIIVGLLWNNDVFALISLIVIPIIAYSYIITLIVLYKKGLIEISENSAEEIKEE